LASTKAPGISELNLALNRVNSGRKSKILEVE
jgi:hypothetical protein